MKLLPNLVFFVICLSGWYGLVVCWTEPDVPCASCR